LDCEICGNQIKGQPRRVIIEGAKIVPEEEKFNYSTENIIPLTKKEISALIKDFNLM